MNRKGWRWSQWTAIFFAAFTFFLTLGISETFHPVIKRRLAIKKGLEVPENPSIGARIQEFAIVGLIRPVRMLLFDSIVSFTCLYVSCAFGTLFSFFAAVPYTFDTVYGFNIEQSGLVFVSIIIGCFLGIITVFLCDVYFYRKQIPKHPLHSVPPKHRLYPAMIGSIGLPLGLFWFGWTARGGISWAVPAAAIIPFAWGNICVFISTMQYITDTYSGNTVASASSANSLARYTFAGIFPLFTIQSK